MKGVWLLNAWLFNAWLLDQKKVAAFGTILDRNSEPEPGDSSEKMS